MSKSGTLKIKCKYCPKNVNSCSRYCKSCAKIVQRVRTAIHIEKGREMEKEENNNDEAEKKEKIPIFLAFDCANDPMID